MAHLGRYEILQRLARGSVADVLLARASGLEGFARHVVIKQIRPEHASDTRFVSAFLDEARIGASLHHQNIVQVFDIDQVGGSPYFAMEYVHGEDVRRVLAKVCSKNQLVPIEIVVAIGAAAAAGLHYAHEHHGPDRKPLQLVHRDVSPSNILIGYDGSVKLVDFGLAKPALRGSKTRTGALCKAPYMSPELAMGKNIDRRSDLFVLGTVLYELATARRLFKGDNDYLTMAMIVEGEVPPPSSLRPDLPKDFDEIIMRALSKDPGARYQTAYDLRSALESFAIEHELRTSARAVADYLASVFGHRPEPWHEKGAPVEPDNADVDFDASTHGLVPTPTEGVKLIEEASVDAAAPIALAREVAKGMTPDPEPSFEEDEPPTQFDLPPEQEQTATRRGSAPSLSTGVTGILADSTTTAAQPIVDTLATGQHAVRPPPVSPHVVSPHVVRTHAASKGPASTTSAHRTATTRTAPPRDANALEDTLGGPDTVGDDTLVPRDDMTNGGDDTLAPGDDTLAPGDDTVGGGDEPSATVKTPTIAVPASIPPRSLPRAGASPSNATTLPVRPIAGGSPSTSPPARPAAGSQPPRPQGSAPPTSATTTPVRPAGAAPISAPARPAGSAPPSNATATPASTPSASQAMRAHAAANTAGDSPVHLAGPPQPARVPAPPILPPALPPAPTRLDTDAGDEATTVEPPLFPFSEPVLDARPPDEVYVPPPPHTGETELPPLKRWGLVGAVLLIPILIGLLAHACRDDAAPSLPSAGAVDP
jgi:serine/threonine protein kinase